MEPLGPDFDTHELIPAIAQDIETGEVLMMAYMNRQSYEATLECGHAVYWSRSRQKLWRKGEESGHTQDVEQIRVDCDRDTILLRVRQTGPACHEGYRTCFYRAVDGDELTVVERQWKTPDEIYGGDDG